MLVCVDTFSGWVEAFPTARETANTVANTLLTHLIPRPQSSGNLEWANGILKAHLTRLTAELHLSWVDILPAALTHVRTTPHVKMGLTPFELLYGRPYLLTNLPDPPTPLLETYLSYFTLLRSLLRGHADCVLPQPVRDHAQVIPSLALAPGDQVLLKTLTPQPLQPRWTGPFTVVVTTPTAAKLWGHKP